MVEEPNLSLLDRETAAEEVKEHFSESLDLLSELVNYGTNLIPRLLATVEPSLVREMAVGSLLSHAVQNLDAVDQLARGGCCISASVQARTILEASLSLEWMLIDEQQTRARAYYIANLRSELLWLNRYVPGTDQHRMMTREWKRNFPKTDPTSDPDMVAAARERIPLIVEKLESPELAELNGRFQRISDKRGFEPSWQKVLEMSARAIANQLSRLAEYEVFYRLGSSASHAASYWTRFQARDGRMLLHPIRGIDSLSTLLNQIVPLAHHTYLSALRYFRPEEVGNFCRKYIEEWRKRALTIPKIDVAVSVKTNPYRP